MKSKKKIVASVGAVGLAAVIALGGTFAWQSISQTALNETMDTINPGGRLHDDFNGSNKDVYVENFTSGEGATTIFARVRLDEYMEIGMGAGNPEAVNRENITVIGSGELDDVTSWTTRKPGTENMTEDTVFGEYWDWNMGGQTTYMPTFNKNKDSLQADINGTYDATDGTNHYTDYVDYTDEANASKTADAYYDADTNDAYEGTLTDGGAGGTVDVNYTAVEEEHNATLTDTATVITMDEWLELEEDARTGNFWVWDEDGWAYWAQPIEPGETTGLLLDEIVHANPPSDSWYYGINVVGQFVTADDIGFLNDTGFYDTSDGKSTAPTANAELLLETITGTNIPSSKVNVTADDSAATVAAGDTLQFTAAVTDKDNQPIADAEVTWSVSGATQDDTTIEGGLLSVSASEAADTELTVTATYMDGDEAVTDSVTVTVTAADGV